MHKKRKFFPFLFVSFWVLLFSFGLSQVFLYLQGYNPFSLFSKREIQSGYATFSSSSPLFLNGNYLGKGFIYGRYELGRYSLCAESLGYSSKCYLDVLIQGNDYASLEKEGVFLSPKNIEDNAVFWTDAKLFYRSNGDFFWYDDLKRQIFFVEKLGVGVSSFFPKYPVISIEYDENIGKYVLWGNNEKGEKVQMFVPFSSGENPYFLQLFSKKNIYNIEGLKKMSDGFFHLFKESNNANKILSFVFDAEIDQILQLNDEGGYILVFNENAYFLSSLEDEMWFFLSLDEETKLLFIYRTGDVFFRKDGKLFSVNIL